MSFGRMSLVVFPILLLGCRAPVAILRERPPQSVQVVIKDAALASDTAPSVKADMEQEAGHRLAEALGRSRLGPLEPWTGIVLRVTVEDMKPNPYLGRGVGYTMLYDTGIGALVGATVGSGLIVGKFTSPQAAAAGAGLGAVCGFVGASSHHQANQRLHAEIGYLPWGCSVRWELLEHESSGQPWRHGSGVWNFRSNTFLEPLGPGAKGDTAQVRRRSLMAAMDEMLAHLGKEGVVVPRPPVKRR